MDDLEQYTRYSPLSAAWAGRDQAGQRELYQRFSTLPDEVQDALVSTDTAEKIQLWEQQGIFPATHSSAVAKLVALSILGIIQPDQIPTLLQKINLDPAIVRQTTEAILSIVDPALAFLKGYNQPESPEEMAASPAEEIASAPSTPPLKIIPPLTTTQPAGPNVPTRNIIDLRK